MDEKEAPLVLQKGKVKVAWVNRRLLWSLEVCHCFCCLGYGHTWRTWSGPDRNYSYWRCGGGDHNAAVCTANLLCVPCTDIPGAVKDHAPGSDHAPESRASRAFPNCCQMIKFIQANLQRCYAVSVWSKIPSNDHQWAQPDQNQSTLVLWQVNIWQVRYCSRLDWCFGTGILRRLHLGMALLGQCVQCVSYHPPNYSAQE